MQKRICYEVEIIADESIAPSLAQLHWFFLDSIRAAEKAASAHQEVQSHPRRGRPRSQEVAGAVTPSPPSNRPEEQLFMIRRTEAPLGVYLGEPDESVGEQKTPRTSPSRPAPRPDSGCLGTPLYTTGVSREPQFMFGITEIDETA